MNASSSLREFGKVVVVTQAVATFDVNAGWATSGT